jgi:hypothetical protein
MNHFLKATALFFMVVISTPFAFAGVNSLPPISVSAPVGKLTVALITASSPVLKIVTSNPSQWIIKRVVVPFSVTPVSPQAQDGYLVAKPGMKNAKPDNIIVFYRNGKYQSFNFIAK